MSSLTVDMGLRRGRSGRPSVPDQVAARGDMTLAQKQRLAMMAKMGLGPMSGGGELPTSNGPSKDMPNRGGHHASIDRKAALLDQERRMQEQQERQEEEEARREQARREEQLRRRANGIQRLGPVMPREEEFQFLPPSGQAPAPKAAPKMDIKISKETADLAKGGSQPSVTILESRHSPAVAAATSAVAASASASASGSAASSAAASAGGGLHQQHHQHPPHPSSTSTSAARRAGNASDSDSESAGGQVYIRTKRSLGSAPTKRQRQRSKSSESSESKHRGNDGDQAYDPVAGTGDDDPNGRAKGSSSSLAVEREVLHLLRRDKLERSSKSSTKRSQR